MELTALAAPSNAGKPSSLSAYVDASGQQENQQHDDEYPGPSGHCDLLLVDSPE
jgi:hypothetical protein